MEEAPDDDDDHIERMVTDFFAAPTKPATVHEEWLLRLCAQLMHREATAIAALEARGQLVSVPPPVPALVPAFGPTPYPPRPPRRRWRGAKRTSSSASAASTEPSTPTGGACSEA